MENLPKKQEQEKDKLATDQPKVKTNKYTPEEKKFADGEGSKLDDAIDSDGANPATRGD
jgi:hypothetical protein